MRGAFMHSEIEELSRRLCAAEREIARARRRSAATNFAGLAVAAFVVLGMVWSAPLQAGDGPQPLTVRAPFVVVDGNNKPIMIVRDDVIVTMKDLKTGKETSSVT